MKLRYRILLMIGLLLLTASDWKISHAEDEIRSFGPGSATSAAWSPDGSQIAIGGYYHLALYTSELTSIATFDTDDVLTTLIWNPNNKQIATASRARSVQLWDVPSGRVQTLYTASIADNRYSGSVSYSPDGTLLASAHLDNAIRIWDTTTGQLKKIMTLKSPTYAVAWHPDGKLLAVGSEITVRSEQGERLILPSIQLWDVASEQIIKKLDTEPRNTGHDYAKVMASEDFIPVSFLQWYADGKKLLMQASDFWLNRSGWDITTDGSSPERINAFAACGASHRTARAAPDGINFAVGETSSGCSGRSGQGESWWEIQIVTQDQGDPSWRWLNIGPGEIRDIAWHPDSHKVAVVGGDGRVVIALISADEYTQLLEPEIILVAHQRMPNNATWSADGSQILTEYYEDGYITRDILSDKQLQIIKPTGEYFFVLPETSHDRTMFVTVDDQNQLAIFETASGKVLRLLSGAPLEDRSSYLTPVWSPDDTHIALIYGSSLLIWESQSGELISEHEIPQSRILAWSPDSRFLAIDKVKREATVLILDTITGLVHMELTDRSGWPLDFVWSPDSTYLAVMTPNSQAAIWNIQQQEQVAVIEAVNIIWSPDSQRFAVRDTANHLTIRESADGLSLVSLDAEILDVNFHPNNSIMATAQTDGSIKIWDVADGRLLNSRTLHREAVLWVKWSPDGNQLMTYGRDGLLKIWTYPVTDD